MDGVASVPKNVEDEKKSGAARSRSNFGGARREITLHKPRTVGDKVIYWKRSRVTTNNHRPCKRSLLVGHTLAGFTGNVNTYNFTALLLPRLFILGATNITAHSLVALFYWYLFSGLRF